MVNPERTFYWEKVSEEITRHPDGVKIFPWFMRKYLERTYFSMGEASLLRVLADQSGFGSIHKKRGGISFVRIAPALI